MREEMAQGRKMYRQKDRNEEREKGRGVRANRGKGKWILTGVQDTGLQFIFFFFFVTVRNFFVDTPFGFEPTRAYYTS